MENKQNMPHCRTRERGNFNTSDIYTWPLVFRLGTWTSIKSGRVRLFLSVQNAYTEIYNLFIQ